MISVRKCQCIKFGNIIVHDFHESAAMVSEQKTADLHVQSVPRFYVMAFAVIYIVIWLCEKVCAVCGKIHPQFTRRLFFCIGIGKSMLFVRFLSVLLCKCFHRFNNGNRGQRTAWLCRNINCCFYDRGRWLRRRRCFRWNNWLFLRLTVAFHKVIVQLSHITDRLRILSEPETQQLPFCDFLLDFSNLLHIRHSKERLFQTTIIGRFLQKISQHSWWEAVFIFCIRKEGILNRRGRVLCHQNRLLQNRLIFGRIGLILLIHLANHSRCARQTLDSTRKKVLNIGQLHFDAIDIAISFVNIYPRSLRHFAQGNRKLRSCLL